MSPKDLLISVIFSKVNEYLQKDDKIDLFKIF